MSEVNFKNIILYFSPISFGNNGLKEWNQFHPSAPIQYYSSMGPPSGTSA